MKRIGLALLLTFVVTSFGNFLIHGTLLKSTYAQYPNLVRTQADANQHAAFLLVAFAVFSIGFVWIYAKWRGASIRDGLKYGFAVWLIASVSRYSIYYAIQPWAAQTALLQLLYELPLMLLLGLIVGAVVNYETRN